MLDGLPFALRMVGRHFSEPELLDIALTVEQQRPWPLMTLADA
jgi:aspartyl-tRNA(Asn)/glutamyl-tRNA(Gln) amidotransferase subunit A